MELLDYGTAMRHVGETKMNSTSSRSHCIFTFKTSVTSPNGKQTNMSQTHLVDLAGSERTSRTKAKGDRLKEGVAINQSLSTLARVISELAKKTKHSQPPFRDSKLTYILKESLCGNSKTFMIAAISPSSADYDETVSTMKFAQSAKQVQTKAVANRMCENAIEMKLREELEVLRAQLAQHQESSKRADRDPAWLEAAQKQIQEQEQLCAWLGKDWDSFLAQERQRVKRRRAILQTPDIEALREGAENSPFLGEMDDASSSSSAGEARCRVVTFSRDKEPIGDTSHPSRAVEGTLLVRGSAAVSMQEELGGAAAVAAEAERLTAEFRMAKKAAREAHDEFVDCSGPQFAAVQLDVWTGITIEREGLLHGDIVVHASREGWSSPAIGDDSQEEARADEWVSRAELQRRMLWLQGASTNFRGDAWLEASKAASAASLGASSPAPAPPPPEPERGEEEKADEKSEEEERLRSELEDAQAELEGLNDRLELLELAAQSVTERGRAAVKEAAVERTQQAKKDLALARSRSGVETATLQEKLTKAQARLAEEERAAASAAELQNELAEAKRQLAAEEVRLASARREVDCTNSKERSPTGATETPLRSNAITVSDLRQMITSGFDQVLSRVDESKAKVEREVSRRLITLRNAGFSVDSPSSCDA